VVNGRIHCPLQLQPRYKMPRLGRLAMKPIIRCRSVLPFFTPALLQLRFSPDFATY
jgi:hypothetical protein